MDYDALRKALLSKARAEENRTGRHIKYYAKIGGAHRFVTLTSHGVKGQISKPLLGKIAKQLRLNGQQLQQFVDCTLSRDEWLEIRGISPRQV